MSAAKKRKIGNECRVFNDEWTAKYCFTNVGSKAVCLLCRECVSVFKEYNLKRHHQTKHLDFGHNLTNEERKRKCQELVNNLKKQQTVFTKQSLIQDAATEASLVLSQKIVKRNKPFSDGEFIKECLSDAANIMCPEQKTKFDSISLSRRTVVRRVEKISDNLMHQLRDASKDFLWYSLALDESTDVQDTAQLFVFIRGINTRFELTEELLSVESLKDTNTGQDLFSAVVNCVERTGLVWSKIASVTTDGARALTGKNVGLVKLMNNKIKEEHPDHTLLPLHCVIHQESLCKAALNIEHVIDPVVSVINLIRARALNHRQFKAMLEDLETEHSDIIYHSSVRWLSLGKILRRVWDLKEEIVMFLEMKGIDCDFVTNIVNEEWKSDFMFAIDIMEKLNELNVKLQGNSLFAHEMYVHVKSFQAKLSLFSRQAGESRFCHFPLLKQKTISGEMADRYKAQLDALVVEFERRFQDFKNLEPLFNILSSPFSAEADSAPEDIQLELLDLQADYDLKEKFKSVLLLEFYGSLSAAAFPHLKNFAAKLLSLFGSTYICEQAFSCLKINKSKNRSMVTDCNLNAVMRITTSKLVPQFRNIIQNCEQLHTSH